MGLSRLTRVSNSPQIMGNKNGQPVLRDQDVADFIKTSRLDEVQIREAFKSFMNDHPKGTMKPADFNQMIKRALPSVDPAKLEKHVFRVYDTNNDGVIDFIEFMVVYHVMSDGTPDEEMGRLVKDMYALIR